MPNHLIPFEDAITMASLFREERENILQEEYREANLLPIAETFDKAAVIDLLSQENCQGLRIYYGMTSNLQVHAILVGVNQNNEDMLPPELWTVPRTYVENKGELLEEAQRCPESCPPSSPLNAG